MALGPGTRLGAYEILTLIGSGGMGEVYKAKDTRLDRIVAVKILPEALAADPQFRDRFDREARAISQLDHPNICALYDVGNEHGTSYLVMQYLEGETLESRLNKGALPLDQALTTAIEIASALDKAHRAGIVHRDLKPGNIMLTKAGAKLLDFGLAKASGPAIAGAGLSMLPTTPPNITAQGTILGTFQYMAPEQIDGEDADVRTDIFAFGCVLYEMLAGARAFTGKTPASVFGAILKETTPPVSAIVPLAPPALDRLVARCLAKERDDRWQTARDLRAELEWITQSDATPTAAVTSAHERRRPTALAIAALAACAAALLTTPIAVRHWRETPVEARPIWFHFRPPEGQTIASTRAAPQFAVSPDGQKVVYAAAASDGTTRLWLQRFDAPAPQPIGGTEDGANPFWAPDSRWVGFASAGQKLLKVDSAVGTTQTICNIVQFSGATWNQSGDIVFSSGRPRLLYRISAAGGTPVSLTTLDRGRQEQNHTWPQFVADGRHVLFHVDAAEAQGIFVTDLERTTAPKQIAIVDSVPLYASGHLLFARGATLVAQTFDVNRLELIGDATPIASGVGSAYSASSNGVLTFRAASTTDLTQLTWFTRQGQMVGTVGARAGYQALSLSPDERQVAAEIADARTGQNDVWVTDAVRGITSRLTFAHGPDEMPVWSPDGARIAFDSHRNNALTIFARPPGGGPEQKLAADGHVVDWSADGRYLLLVNLRTDLGLWAVATTGDQKPFPVVSKSQGRAVQSSQFSPNGKWVVYSSDESGQPQVYVTTFPTAATTWQISNNGGDQPRWPRNGGEIIYLAPDGKLMTVPVKRGATFEAEAPKPLFEIHINRSVNGRAQYAVSADGQRFLVNALTSEPSAQSETTVILNWPALLKK